MLGVEELLRLVNTGAREREEELRNTFAMLAVLNRVGSLQRRQRNPLNPDGLWTM